MILSPSILSADFGILREQVKIVEDAGAKWLHIDVMDGVFVPNISFGAVVVKSLRPYTKLFFDVHLMIVRPEKYIKDFVDAGADLITFHAEAAEDILGCIELIKSYGIKAGISINPQTDTDILTPYLKQIDMALVMSVNPGYGGQAYIDSADEKIKYLRGCMGDDFLIQVDGGIHSGNIGHVVKCGANVIVAGSAVFNDDIAGSVRTLINNA